MRTPVTIALVSWNTRDLLARCLRSLASDVAAGRADVWVWDNASSDGSAEMAGASFPWAHVVAWGENLGFGRAVNEVARRTESAWLAAANADIEVRPGALEALLAAGSRDGGAGIVAPRLLLPDGTTQHSVHAFPTVASAAALEMGLAGLHPALGERLCLHGHWNPDRRRRVDWAHGAFLLLRRRPFESVGGFPRDQWMYAEDLDLAWRMRRAGWHVLYEPEAVVRHAVAAATSAAFGSRRDARHWAAAYRWLASRRGIAAARAYAVVGVAAMAARLLLWSPLAAVLPGRFAGRRDRALRWLRLHRIGLRPRRELMGEL